LKKYLVTFQLLAMEPAMELLLVVVGVLRVMVVGVGGVQVVEEEVAMEL
jgi:hypothetical protein